MKFHKILVPVDFSDCSGKAFRYALNLARKFNSELTLLHINQIVLAGLSEEEASATNLQMAEMRKVEYINEQMELYLEQARPMRVPVCQEILPGHHIADSIIDYLNEDAFDLVVLGTHGHTGLKHLLLGSIAEKVIRLSPTPVLTVHATEAEFRISDILAPVDFSQHSQLAARYALAFAKEFEAKLHLLHVVEQFTYPAFYPEGYYPIVDFEPEVREKASKNLKSFFKEIADQAVETAVVCGKPCDEIINYVENNGISMIIMATRGLTGLEHLLVGSTAERVVRLSTTPVLTVRANPHEKSNPSQLSESEK